jgi:hypothetical protein
MEVLLFLICLILTPFYLVSVGISVAIIIAAIPVAILEACYLVCHKMVSTVKRFLRNRLLPTQTNYYATYTTARAQSNDTSQYNNNRSDSGMIIPNHTSSRQRKLSKPNLFGESSDAKVNVKSSVGKTRPQGSGETRTPVAKQSSLPSLSTSPDRKHPPRSKELYPPELRQQKRHSVTLPATSASNDTKPFVHSSQQPPRETVMYSEPELHQTPPQIDVGEPINGRRLGRTVSAQESSRNTDTSEAASLLMALSADDTSSPRPLQYTSPTPIPMADNTAIYRGFNPLMQYSEQRSPSNRSFPPISLQPGPLSSEPIILTQQPTIPSPRHLEAIITPSPPLYSPAARRVSDTAYYYSISNPGSYMASQNDLRHEGSSQFRPRSIDASFVDEFENSLSTDHLSPENVSNILASFEMLAPGWGNEGE